jgi:hypothetical protein
MSKRKYRMLFSPDRRRQPGPKGPRAELIRAVVETKQRNPNWAILRIAQQMALAFHSPRSGRSSFAATGFPPLLNPHYKLEADSKFCAPHTLAVSHARQRLDAFLWSGNQHMLPRSAVPVSNDARAARTHIFSDRPLIRL